MNDTHERNQEALSRRAKWAVYQCPKGCVHVRLQNVTLTLSPCEFAQFVEMLGDAYVRLGVRAAVATLRPQ
ncbi:MAG: hypothetical protein HYU37_21310 [Acidobacteria bacterium]|nr:hypothetical protein [Acidobacteriota bacterium]